MRFIISATFLLCFGIGLISWLRIPEEKKLPIRFRQLTSTIKSDTSAVIDIKIDNGEREREFTAYCTLWPDSFVIRVEIPAWYYNYSKTFTATIPIK